MRLKRMLASLLACAIALASFTAAASAEENAATITSSTSTVAYYALGDSNATPGDSNATPGDSNTTPDPDPTPGDSNVTPGDSNTTPDPDPTPGDSNPTPGDSNTTPDPDPTPGDSDITIGGSKHGDLDNDGVIDIVDDYAVIKVITSGLMPGQLTLGGSTPNYYEKYQLADVNKDGKVNVGDVIWFNKYLVGYITYDQFCAGKQVQ